LKIQCTIDLKTFQELAMGESCFIYISSLTFVCLQFII
jgi:hypothetical protein